MSDYDYPMYEIPQESMYSELEQRVMQDMIEHGYNPLKSIDIETYWKERL